MSAIDVHAHWFPPEWIALLANKIQVVFTNPATIIAQVKAGPVRAQQTEMTAEQKQQMKADLEATGLVAKAQQGFAKMERRAA